MLLRIKIGTTTPNTYIDLQSIFITPQKSATIKYAVIDDAHGSQNKSYEMEGDQYARWGNDDTLIYHLLCARHKLQYKPFEEPEFYEEVNVWRDDATGEMKSEIIKRPNPSYTGVAPKVEYVPIPEGEARTQDDNRSVHNEADIQRIQTLQEQLDAQAAKLKTITDLLFKNGAI